MSILPQALQRTLRSIAAHVLPGSCLLCSADSAASLLCPACTADLPQLPAALCPQCGEETTLGERCGACLKDPPAFARTIALFRYEFPVDRLIQALKYGHQLPLAAWLGLRLGERLVAADYDLLLPLPLHPSRLKTRGFNQSLEIARVTSRALGIPLNPAHPHPHPRHAAAGRIAAQGTRQERARRLRMRPRPRRQAHFIGRRRDDHRLDAPRSGPHTETPWRRTDHRGGRRPRAAPLTP